MRFIPIDNGLITYQSPISNWNIINFTIAYHSSQPVFADAATPTHLLDCF